MVEILSAFVAEVFLNVVHVFGVNLGQLLVGQVARSVVRVEEAADHLVVDAGRCGIHI